MLPPHTPSDIDNPAPRSIRKSFRNQGPDSRFSTNFRRSYVGTCVIVGAKAAAKLCRWQRGNAEEQIECRWTVYSSDEITRTDRSFCVPPSQPVTTGRGCLFNGEQLWTGSRKNGWKRRQREQSHGTAYWTTVVNAHCFRFLRLQLARKLARKLESSVEPFSHFQRGSYFWGRGVIFSGLIDFDELLDEVWSFVTFQSTCCLTSSSVSVLWYAGGKFFWPIAHRRGVKFFRGDFRTEDVDARL